VRDGDRRGKRERLDGADRMSRLISSLLLTPASIPRVGSSRTWTATRLAERLANLQAAIRESGAAVESGPAADTQGRPGAVGTAFPEPRRQCRQVFHDQRPPVVRVSARRLTANGSSPCATTESDRPRPIRPALHDVPASARPQQVPRHGDRWRRARRSWNATAGESGCNPAPARVPPLCSRSRKRPS